MGAIELQIFVSLVVILGAAFVALICDFLKGNNEQLRESNIEMRVRQHEREKREEILDKVQRHTIETLVQARVAPPVAVAAAPAKPVVAQASSPVQAQQPHQTGADRPEARDSYERTQQERSARRREGRRQQPPPVVVDTPVIPEAGQVPAWAQSIVLKGHPHSLVPEIQPVVAEVRPVVAEVEPVVVEAAPVVAEVQPVAAEVELVVVEAAPVAAEVEPVVVEAEPVVAEVEPVFVEAAPVVAEVQPVAAEVELVVVEAAPVAAEVEPVVVEAAPVLAEVEPVVESAPPLAGTQPVSVRPAVCTSPMVLLAAASIDAQSPLLAALPISTLTAGTAAVLEQVETPERLALSVVGGLAQCFQQAPASLPVSGEYLLPQSGLVVEQPVYEIVEATAAEIVSESAAEIVLEEQLPELDSPVVRIRVLSDSDVLPMDEPLELTLPMADAEPIQLLESPVLSPVAQIEPILTAEPLVPALPVAEIETVVSAAAQELVLPMAMTEPALPIVTIEPIQAVESFEPALPVAEIETAVFYAEPLEMVLPVDEPELIAVAEPLEPALPVAEIETVIFSEPLEQVLPVADAEPILAAEPFELALPAAEIETVVSADSSFEIAAEIPELIAPIAHEPRQLVTPHVEIRSNVVEMPSTPAARNIEPEQPVMADLVIPGGFHEASALARLLEEEAPFNGLAIVISVVDYVRLMADQGKPAAEQMMGSISRLVMSLTREQDFACRIAEDEFVLLFARETGASAKRRIQLVSERLWDFQLRSLGSVSVIFSWGASESTKDAVVQAVEHAREQMLESRRNRRALASGVGRFRRRVANS